MNHRFLLLLISLLSFTAGWSAVAQVVRVRLATARLHAAPASHSLAKHILKQWVWRGARWVDEEFVGRLRRRSPGSPGLLILTTHSLFADATEAKEAPMDPQQALTVADLEEAIRILKGAGYRFVGPEDLGGARPHERIAMLTFDDGYANNLRALAVLEQHEVPAVFFVTTRHVESGCAFWWDLLYRLGRAEGWSDGRLVATTKELKQMSNRDIEARIVSDFPAASFRPAGDLDRPLTPDELRLLAAHPLARIGNHTEDHENLALLNEGEAARNIGLAQDKLEALTGVRPAIIAYPYGAVASHVPLAAHAAGLLYGLTTLPRKNALPLAPGTQESLSLGRHTLWGGRRIDLQLASYRSGASILSMIAGRRGRGCR